MDLFLESVAIAARVLASEQNQFSGQVIIQRGQHTNKEPVTGMCHHLNNLMCMK